MIDSLRAVGIFFLIAGIICLSAASRELPVLGAGLIRTGILLLAARFGALRGWKGFPHIPAALALAALVHAALKIAKAI